MVYPPIDTTLGGTRKEVLEDGEFIHYFLGHPTFADAGALGSLVHWHRWIWTNLAPSHVLTTALSRVTWPTERKVDNIVDAHRITFAVSKDDDSPLAQMNKVGGATL